MENIKIAETKRSPGVDFNFQTNAYTLMGRSYLEDANHFFNPIMANLVDHLDCLNDADVVFDFRMDYFNSVSARFIYRVIELLEVAAKRGNNVTINWFYEEDDDAMEEQGEELGEDLEFASFELKEIPEE